METPVSYTARQAGAPPSWPQSADDPVADMLFAAAAQQSDFEPDIASRSFRRLQNRRGTLWLPTLHP